MTNNNMTHDELIKCFDDMVAKARQTMIDKNKDYANTDALSNFKLSGAAVGISPQLCCLNQIAIKVSRLGVLFNVTATPKNESVQDNALDLFVYSFLLRAILDDIGTGRRCVDSAGTISFQRV